MYVTILDHDHNSPSDTTGEDTRVGYCNSGRSTTSTNIEAIERFREAHTEYDLRILSIDDCLDTTGMNLLTIIKRCEYLAPDIVTGLDILNTIIDIPIYISFLIDRLWSFVMRSVLHRVRDSISKDPMTSILEMRNMLSNEIGLYF
jgi:hypothetical protein